MAEIGSTTTINLGQDLISRADGTSPLTGDAGVYAYTAGVLETDRGNSLSLQSFGALPSPPGVYYVMRGVDVDCGPLTYRKWVVLNAPDTTGAQYAGTKCGESPLTDIVIVNKYTK